MNTKKERIFVTRPFLPPIEEYFEEIQEIWESSWLTNNGLKHKRFEKQLEQFCNANYINLFVNGTLALELAIKAMDLKGEIITTPFTFAATTHAITLNNIRPVFCDIEKDYFNIDVNKIEDLITEKTTAIMPVHIFGNPCDVEAINKLAKKYNLKVLYDAAHAFGVRINDRPISQFGDATMFSFHATKVFHSIEGGALAHSNENMYKELNLLKNFGIADEETIERVGTNAKMNEFQAAMGIVNLRYIHQAIEKRKAITYKYRSLLRGIEGIRFLEDIENVKHNYSYFPILVEDSYKLNRDELYKELKASNIYSRKYYYPLSSNFKSNQDDTCTDLPVANYVADRVLTLPLYPQLTDDIIEQVCSVIQKAGVE